MDTGGREPSVNDLNGQSAVRTRKRTKEMTAKVSPVRRFFARVFDMAIVLAVLLPVYHFAGLLSLSVHNFILIQVIYTGVFFVYDILMNSISGGTCGKMLLGLAVTGGTKSHPGIGVSFVRSLLFITAGAGLLIPPLAAVTTFICFVVKLNGKTLPWESKAPVYAHHITGLRVAWSTLLVAAILLVGMIPSIISYLRLVPHTGNITEVEFREDYDVVEGKYLASLDDTGRAYDPSFYESNKLYNMPEFKFSTDENGIVKGFTYADAVPPGEEYGTQRRDLAVMGITTLIASVKSNRTTYNISVSNFSAVFERPFEDHDITSGGVRVIHTSKKGPDGQLVIYEVSFAEEGNQ